MLDYVCYRAAIRPLRQSLCVQFVKMLHRPVVAGDDDIRFGCRDRRFHRFERREAAVGKGSLDRGRVKERMTASRTDTRNSTTGVVESIASRADPGFR